MDAMHRLDAAMARRQVLWLGAMAGISAAAMPRLALAADDPELLPRVRQVIESWVGPGKFPGMIASLGLPGRDPLAVRVGHSTFALRRHEAALVRVAAPAAATAAELAGAGARP